VGRRKDKPTAKSAKTQKCDKKTAENHLGTKKKVFTRPPHETAFGQDGKKKKTTCLGNGEILRRGIGGTLIPVGQQRFVANPSAHVAKTNTLRPIASEKKVIPKFPEKEEKNPGQGPKATPRVGEKRCDPAPGQGTEGLITKGRMRMRKTKKGKKETNQISPKTAEQLRRLSQEDA